MPQLSFTTRVCVICEVPLVRRADEPAWSFAKRETCSRPCRDKLAGQRIRRTPEPRTCEACGVVFSRRDDEAPHNFRKRMTCSLHCKGVRINALLRSQLIQRRAEGLLVGQVPLANGMIALVDPEDYARAMQHLWSGRQAPNSDRWYVSTEIDGKKVKLHRFILDAQPGELIDHWDRDGLNNRRQNLRRATSAQNATNRKKAKGSASPYKGVSWHAKLGRWQVAIKENGKLRRLGIFDDPADAARAYDEAARRIQGEYARLNFPREDEQAAFENWAQQPAAVVTSDSGEAA